MEAAVIYRANSKFTSSINLRASRGHDGDELSSQSPRKEMTRKFSPVSGIRTMLSNRTSTSSSTATMKREKEAKADHHPEPSMPIIPSQRNFAHADSRVSLMMDEYSEFITDKRKSLIGQLKERSHGLLRRKNRN